MAKKTAAARRSPPKAPPIKRAHVHPERPRPEPATTQRRAVTAADVPGTQQHAARHARRQAAGHPGAGIKVQAKQDGYYGHIRRRAGDVFTIAKEEDFSTKWMRKVDPRKRESVTLSNDVIRQKHDETLALRHGDQVAGGRAVPPADDELEDEDPLGAGD
jgi:hypothetical protein